jgi:hypothetical protein
MTRTTGLLAIAVALALLVLPGCVGPAPWERSVFARPQMAPDAGEPVSRLNAHIHQSREGTTPLDRSGGGGCGCY